jgi:hypothetical protein
MYALIENNIPIEFPILDIRAKFSNISFPQTINTEDLPASIVEVILLVQPTNTDNTKEYILNSTPTYNPSTNMWELGWTLVSKSPVQIANELLITKQQYITAVQHRLDSFANSRGYDSILSACTYATSTNPKFSIEGQRCVDLRDATWTTMYEIDANVANGTISQPTNIGEIIAMLPPLTWTN